MAGLLSRSEQFDSGDRKRLTRSPVTTAVVPASHLDVTPGHHLVVDFLLFRTARTHNINNRYWISTVVTVLGKFSSWDRAHAQRTCRRVAARPRRVGTSSFCRVIRSIIDVPCTRYPVDRFPLEPHAALPPVAHAARRTPPPFYLGPTMKDFPPKARGPVLWLPGGSRLCPLLQLTADWEVEICFLRRTLSPDTAAATRAKS
uniref:Uncharacterized protein n=1 Tax=Hyaloperonospora arabidopsidis (strain Emoy2) TaxID=559515 RepID=M4B6E4_HYAAE